MTVSGNYGMVNVLAGALPPVVEPYPKNGHCTEAGYALIADVVVRELDARGMLPETLRRADQPAAASIPFGER